MSSGKSAVTRCISGHTAPPPQKSATAMAVVDIPVVPSLFGSFPLILWLYYLAVYRISAGEGWQRWSSVTHRRVLLMTPATEYRSWLFVQTAVTWTFIAHIPSSDQLIVHSNIVVHSSVMRWLQLLFDFD